MDDDLNQLNWRRGRDALSSGGASPVGPSSYGDPDGLRPTRMAFSIGNVLGTGFRVWFRNVVPFLLITALLYSPPWIWAWSDVHSGLHLDDAKHIGYVFVAAVYLTIPLNIFVSATLTYGVVMELHGQRASIGACIATGLVRFFPALGVGIVMCICVGVASFALLVPGLFVYCVMYVAMQVSVVERRGVFEALSRSGVLTSGHRWAIAVVFVLQVVLWFVLGKLGQSCNTTLFGLPQSLPELQGFLLRQIYIVFVQQVIIGSLFAVIAAVSYVFLRAEKDGTSTAELAAIFE